MPPLGVCTGGILEHSAALRVVLHDGRCKMHDATSHMDLLGSFPSSPPFNDDRR